jgi:hypothetical protein
MFLCLSKTAAKRKDKRLILHIISNSLQKKIKTVAIWIKILLEKKATLGCCKENEQKKKSQPTQNKLRFYFFVPLLVKLLVFFKLCYTTWECLATFYFISDHNHFEMSPLKWSAALISIDI